MPIRCRGWRCRCKVCSCYSAENAVAVGQKRCRGGGAKVVHGAGGVGAGAEV